MSADLNLEFPTSLSHLEQKAATDPPELWRRRVRPVSGSGHGNASERRFDLQGRDLHHRGDPQHRWGPLADLCGLTRARIVPFCSLVSDLWMRRRSAVRHGPGGGEPDAGGHPTSGGGHRLSSGGRHCVVPGTDERRRPRLHRRDSLCEGRHGAASPLSAKRSFELYRHRPRAFHYSEYDGI